MGIFSSKRYTYYKDIPDEQILHKELRRSVSALHNINLQRVDRPEECFDPNIFMDIFENSEVVSTNVARRSELPASNFIA